MQLKQLSAVASKVDIELAKIDSQVDWLTYLSPVDNDANWQTFKDCHFSTEPNLRYLPIPEHYARLKKQVRNVPVDDVEEPALHALFFEKRMELELQIDLVLMRNTPGFIPISVGLFGGAEPSLLHLAKQILHQVPLDDGPPDNSHCEDLVAAANNEFAQYRQREANFNAKVLVMDDLNSMMMVHNGDFKIARSVHLPKERILPLIAHEVGTHVVTRYNGKCQPIKLFEYGLADYDPLQEGLGTLAEYLAGYLPPRRLRTIAARVVATELALNRKSIVEIFQALHEEYKLPVDDAFDVAVRASRGGGLTKDSVYLRGMRELLAYLADGGDINFLYLGKFAIGQRASVNALLQQGWLQPAKLLPRHLLDEKSQQRLARVRNLELRQLFQEEPEI